MTHSRSRISDALGAADGRTRLRIPDHEPRVDRARMEDFYARACVAFARDRPDDQGGRCTHRLYWGREGVLFSRDLGIAPWDYAVVGRHSRCDLRLLDAEVSLRHVLIEGTRLSDGRRLLRAIDLRAQLPFHLVDDVPRRSIVATGPVMMRVGRWMVVALALDGSVPPPSLPDVEVASVPDLASAVRSDPDASAVSSRISAVPAATEVTELGTVDLASGDALITVCRGGLSARVAVRRSDLERGVLIGRASRCLDDGVRAVLDAHISRAHLLLLSDGGEVRAYDVCSTNGTHVAGRRVRAATLSDAGAELVLGRRTGVVVRYRRRR